ncbi:hypothetical protein CEXT_815351 [Caerostris extrusa]|uniref:Uncharacterized protein n=1 Tax=Caerostris extrusa TaxID=172846 RepID=A0AAV4N0U4_CAEEX|nr:hypothetical protein CEXT_815351 [Caerostris extrusa]
MSNIWRRRKGPIRERCRKFRQVRNVQHAFKISKSNDSFSLVRGFTTIGFKEENLLTRCLTLRQKLRCAFRFICRRALGETRWKGHTTRTKTFETENQCLNKKTDTQLQDTTPKRVAVRF